MTELLGVRSLFESPSFGSMEAGISSDIEARSDRRKRKSEELKPEDINMKIFLVHGGETDVVRIFDENLKLTEEKMRGYLKEVDLEGQGFIKTVEVSTETDENGRIINHKKENNLLQKDR
ncbi:Hypothetical predicted protein [Paramuricea clavata]|uniref:Uncharacterized protein n=1 Tax=Paramuricea clavata TaxID=317549 RepID=A0A6S7IM72_PARCT|nr:Hypothetical predicted protein [Paramuricea clavata]